MRPLSTARLSLKPWRTGMDSSDSMTLSFDPIIAFGQNASSPHYEPSRDNVQPMTRGTCILLDTGGQYRYGTTDITRTLWYDLKEGMSF